MIKDIYYIETGNVDKHDRSFVEWVRVAWAESFDVLRQDLAMIAISTLPDFVRIGVEMANGKRLRTEHTGIEIASMLYYQDTIIEELKSLEAKIRDEQ